MVAPRQSGEKTWVTAAPPVMPEVATLTGLGFGQRRYQLETPGLGRYLTVSKTKRSGSRPNEYECRRKQMDQKIWRSEPHLRGLQT